MPRFERYLAGEQDAFGPGHPLRHASLPLSRKLHAEAPPPDSGARVTYQDYFHAAQSFLEQTGVAQIARVMSESVGRPVASRDIDAVRIFLMKHGQFYHLARVEAHVGENKAAFVLNAAVSADGCRSLPLEYRCLERLNSHFPYEFIPKVYSAGHGGTASGGRIPMLLAQWLDGYHEFHISRHSTGGRQRLSVWMDERGPYLASSHQRRQVYRQAAMILTAYYHPETFEQIFPWHHAAGDFVVKIQTDRVNVKLISVRDYTPLLMLPEKEDHKIDGGRLIMDALLLFFLHLTLRMRLDRQDGVGKFVWADDDTVSAAVQGFFQGLELTGLMRSYQASFVAHVRSQLAAISAFDYYDLGRELIGAHYAHRPEAGMLHQNLRRHVHLVYETLKMPPLSDDGQGPDFDTR